MCHAVAAAAPAVHCNGIQPYRGAAWQEGPLLLLSSRGVINYLALWGRHWPTGAIRTGKGDGDTTLSTAQYWPIQMNYDDYYARQVGGALPYFTGARVQKGHGFGSLFSGLLRSVAPLIK